MKYVIKTCWWSLFDRVTPEEQRINWRIVESESVEKLLADDAKEQSGWLDGGYAILEVYELKEPVYKLQEDLKCQES